MPAAPRRSGARKGRQASAPAEDAREIATSLMKEYDAQVAAQPHNQRDWGVVLQSMIAAAITAAKREGERRGLAEAIIAWSVCRSIHREYAKRRDPFFKTRQADFEKHENDCRIKYDTLAETTDAEYDRAGPSDGGWREIGVGFDPPRQRIILLWAATSTNPPNWKMATGCCAINFDGELEWTWDGRKLAPYDTKPTHWQPLPAPPEPSK